MYFEIIVMFLPACTMFDSLIQDKIAHMTEDPAKTICHGISAPYTGKNFEEPGHNVYFIFFLQKMK